MGMPEVAWKLLVLLICTFGPHDNESLLTICTFSTAEEK